MIIILGQIYPCNIYLYIWKDQSGNNRLEFPDTVLPAKSDSYVMFCLQSYQGLYRSLMY